MSTPVTTRLNLSVRAFQLRDLKVISAIERASYENPATERNFRDWVHDENMSVLVAESENRVVGFILAEAIKEPLEAHIYDIAVHPDYRRHGVGRTLLGWLSDRISKMKGKRVFANIRESNLPAHLFFKKCGFKATAVIRNFFTDPTEAAYLFERYARILDSEDDGYPCSTTSQ